MSKIIVPVTKNQDPNSQCEWDIPPIQLHNDDVEVIWQLDELNQAYPGGTFWIRFTISPSNDLDKGPFLGEIHPHDQPNALHVFERVHVWGTYIYDIWVSYSERSFALTTPIDPQIDNIAPPPNAPLPPSGRREEREVREMETVETTVGRRP